MSVCVVCECVCVSVCVSVCVCECECVCSVQSAEVMIDFWGFNKLCGLRMNFSDTH